MFSGRVSENEKQDSSSGIALPLSGFEREKFVFSKKIADAFGFCWVCVIYFRKQEFAEGGRGFP